MTACRVNKTLSRIESETPENTNMTAVSGVSNKKNGRTVETINKIVFKKYFPDR